jgi:Tannase and feruloyl esterase
MDRSPASLVQRSLIFLVTAALVLLFGVSIAAAQERIPVADQQPSHLTNAQAVRDLRLPNTTIQSVTFDSRDGAFHVVALVTHPPANDRVTVWIALPGSHWNGNFHGTGGGGYASGFERCLPWPLSMGYAVAATDGGNPSGTAEFALNADGTSNWQGIANNGYLATHDMTVVGKAVTTAFYGKPPKYSFFAGGSSGGRQALTEAQRYPEDYDGILALFPAICRDRYVLGQLWAQLVMRERGDYLPKAKLEAVVHAITAACAGSFGTIDDPLACSFDVHALVGQSMGGSTFTSTDADVVAEILHGPHTQDGRFLWYGPTLGSSLTTVAATKGNPLDGDPMGEGLDWVRYYLRKGKSWDWRTMDSQQYAQFFDESIRAFRTYVGGDDPDLAAFRDHGGRLLIVHGLADDIVPPQATIAYVTEATKRLGGARAASDVLRLFLVPGGNHGLGAPVPEPTIFSAYAALERWVENRHAPEALPAQVLDAAGHVEVTRQLAPFLPGSRPAR